MPRRRRLVIPGVPMHIRQRRVDRARCFVDEADHRLYMGLVGEASKKHDVSVHAYALMPNHVHLLMTPGTAMGPSNFMKAVAQRFAQHFNRKYVRHGHLWESRFSASLVDTELYLFICYRYIELNPVRAGLVTAPGDYPWTSYATNARGVPSVVLSLHPEYLKLGRDEATRLRAYRELVDCGVTVTHLDAIRNAIENEEPLGSHEFVHDIERRLDEHSAVPRQGAAPSC